MNRAVLIERLTAHEGNRDFPYDDATGKALRPGDKLVGNITIGVGINLSAGLSVSERNFLLETRISAAIHELDENAPWWSGLDDARREVLGELTFNLGWPKLSRFGKMLAALQRRDYQVAAIEMRDSIWARQVGQRAHTLADLMQNGDPIPIA